MSPAPSTFARFRRSVIDPVLAFRRDHDPLLLQQAAEALRGVAWAHRPAADDDWTFSATGWVLPEGGVRLRRRDLVRANPGYRIGIRRFGRPELGRRGRLLRVGFVVTAHGPARLPLFRLRTTDRAGAQFELPGSNFEAKFKIARLAEPTGGTERPSSPARVRGYVDDIQYGPRLVEDQPETWVRALVHSQPEELFEIADSDFGADLRAPLADMMLSSGINARWADRFGMMAGSIERSSSDLELLTVVRTDVPTGQAGATLTIPDFHRIGRSVIDWGPSATELRSPSTEWLHLENALLQDGGTVSVGGDLICFESSADPANDFVAGQWMTVYGSHANPRLALVQRRPPGERIDEAILIGGRSDDNWFHWLVEYLPRVLMVPDHIAEDVPLLVSSRTPGNGIQALRELSDRPLIVVDAELAQSVGTLHVVAPPVQVLDTTKLPWNAGLRMNVDAVRRLRHAWELDAPSGKADRRIFLQRRSRHRGLVNEAALARVAERRGLEIVDPSDLSFAQQRQLFSSAGLVAGASGAVMANYLMMQPGSRIIAFTSEQLHDFVLPAALAASVDADFTYLTGRSSLQLRDVVDRNHWVHADFRIDTREMDALLTATLRAMDETGR